MLFDLLLLFVGCIVCFIFLLGGIPGITNGLFSEHKSIVERFVLSCLSFIFLCIEFDQFVFGDISRKYTGWNTFLPLLVVLSAGYLAWKMFRDAKKQKAPQHT